MLGGNEGTKVGGREGLNDGENDGAVVGGAEHVAWIYRYLSVLLHGSPNTAFEAATLHDCWLRQLELTMLIDVAALQLL